MQTIEQAPSIGRLDQRWSAVLRAVAGIGTLMMVAVILVAPRMPVNFYDPLVVGVGVLVVAVVWGISSRPAAAVVRRMLRTDRAVSTAAALLVALNTSVALAVGYFGSYSANWDPRVIRELAGLPVEGWGQWHVHYFSRYPNNLVLLGVGDIAHWTDRIGLGYAPAFALVAAISVAITAVALHRVVALVRGPRWGLLALVLLLLLVSVSPWMGVAYTDLIGLWGPVTAIWMFVAGSRRTGAGYHLLMLASGVVLGFGYLLKAPAISGVVAAVVVLAMGFVTRPGLRRRALGGIAAAVIGVLLGVFGIAAGVRAIVPLPPLEQDVTATPLTYLGAGLDQASYGGFENYGGYSAQLDDDTWDMTSDDQNAYSREFIARIIAQRGVGGTVRFEVDKLLWNNGDGMFWAYAEGSDAKTHPRRSDPFARALMVVNHPTGSLYRARVTVTDIVWLSVMLGAGVGLVVSARRRYVATGVGQTTTASRAAADGIDLLIWTMVGIALFMLLFQGRSRYLFGHVPVAIAMTAAVVPLGIGRLRGAYEVLRARRPGR